MTGETEEEKEARRRKEVRAFLTEPDYNYLASLVEKGEFHTMSEAVGYIVKFHRQTTRMDPPETDKAPEAEKRMVRYRCEWCLREVDLPEGTVAVCMICGHKLVPVGEEKQTPKGVRCPVCGKETLFYDKERGEWVCTECGFRMLERERYRVVAVSEDRVLEERTVGGPLISKTVRELRGKYPGAMIVTLPSGQSLFIFEFEVAGARRVFSVPAPDEASARRAAEERLRAEGLTEALPTLKLVSQE